VLDSLARAKQHVEDRQPDVPYRIVSERLLRTKRLFLSWVDLYKEYTKGYSQEVLQIPSTTTAIIRMLSFDNVNMENLFSEIYDSKIPSEVYILVDDMFSNLRQTVCYNITQGNQFYNWSIYNEIEKQTKKLTAPGSPEVCSSIESIKKRIAVDDVLLLYYEKGQYDNPLYWPLLLHEGLHQIYEKENILQLEKKCPQVSWLQETLIDLYLMHYFGPIYCGSSAIYLSRFPHLITISHPHFIARLYSSMLYLYQLSKSRELPPEFKNEVQQTYGYVKSTWSQYEPHLNSMKEILSVIEVEQIYNETEQDLIKLISTKTKTFQNLIIDTRKKKIDLSDSPAEDYLENQTLFCDDVLEFYAKGLPIAVEPRILFNSFSSKNFLDKQEVSMKFICESLKKWYIKKIWLSKISHV
jgi:hypothetical protein